MGLNPTLLYDGVSLGVLGGSYAPYPPATDGVGFQQYLAINVTSVPEPASLYLSVFACPGVAVWWLRSASSRKHLCI